SSVAVPCGARLSAEPRSSPETPAPASQKDAGLSDTSLPPGRGEHHQAKPRHRPGAAVLAVAGRRVAFRSRARHYEPAPPMPAWAGSLAFAPMNVMWACWAAVSAAALDRLLP